MHDFHLAPRCFEFLLRISHWLNFATATNSCNISTLFSAHGWFRTFGKTTETFVTCLYSEWKVASEWKPKRSKLIGFCTRMKTEIISSHFNEHLRGVLFVNFSFDLYLDFVTHFECAATCCCEITWNIHFKTPEIQLRPRTFYIKH